MMNRLQAIQDVASNTTTGVEKSYSSCLLHASYKRKLPSTPYKVLDAPSLQDDYYSDVLDWSADHIIVALRSKVYLWGPLNSKV